MSNIVRGITHRLMCYGCRLWLPSLTEDDGWCKPHCKNTHMFRDKCSKYEEYTEEDATESNEQQTEVQKND